LRETEKRRGGKESRRKYRVMMRRGKSGCK
jgi:hypothetical protein